MEAAQSHKSYALMALLIYSAKQDITADKIKALCEKLNIEYSAKLASMFVLPKDRIESIISNAGTVSAPVASSGKPAAAEEAADEKESNDSEDAVIEF